VERVVFADFWRSESGRLRAARRWIRLCNPFAFRRASICPNTGRGGGRTAPTAQATIVLVPKQRNTKEEKEAIKAGKTPERGLHRARRGWERQPAKNPISAGGHRVSSWELARGIFRDAHMIKAMT
jgi:hypothetical protein